MSEKKSYSATYQVYNNERLKKVDFHGKQVHPLYLRLTFDRRTTEYRSRIFDLFSKPKFGIRYDGKIYPPPIDRIIEREEKLIEFVINRHPEDFSIELFKPEYDYYSRDLLDEMEPPFKQYVKTFFQDQGNPSLGEALAGVDQVAALYDILLDLKRVLKSDLYQQLIDNSFLFAPPYYPLNHFIEIPLRPPLRLFTIMDWMNATTQERFREFVKRSFPTLDPAVLIDEIEKWIIR